MLFFEWAVAAKNALGQFAESIHSQETPAWLLAILAISV
jgi:hypothetical protein